MKHLKLFEDYSDHSIEHNDKSLAIEVGKQLGYRVGRQIGVGTTGRVYTILSDDTKVMKITSSRREAECANLLKSYNLSHVVKYHEIVRIMNDDCVLYDNRYSLPQTLDSDSNFYVIIMEKLIINKQTSKLYKACMSLMVDFYDSFYIHETGAEFSQQLYDSINDLNLKNFYKELITAINEFVDAKIPNLDFHENNIGYRKDGSIAIFDMLIESDGKEVERTIIPK